MRWSLLYEESTISRSAYNTAITPLNTIIWISQVLLLIRLLIVPIDMMTDSYGKTRAKLKMEEGRLHSLVNGKSYDIGELELASLQNLRSRARSGVSLPGRLKVNAVTGDVRQMHHIPHNAGALFQVASQFNLLEMVSPDVTPEEGVTGYQHDYTQGPACAMTAGAATIYRNYFASVIGISGQTAERQLNVLAGLGESFSHSLEIP